MGVGAEVIGRVEQRAVWDAPNIQFLDLGAGSMGLPSYENSSNCTLRTCAFFFVCVLYFDKNNNKNEKNSELKNPCLCAYTHKRGLPW